MELRAHWLVIRRRLYLVLGLPLLVLCISLVLAPERAPLYAAQMRFVVGLRPEAPPSGEYTYDRYYTWLTAEYLVDDLAEVIKSRRFAEDVSQRAGLSIAPGAIQGATSAGKLHRIVNVSITWPDPAQLTTIAAAVQDILINHPETYFAQLGTDAAVVAVIDPPLVTPVAPSLRERLELPLRTFLGLLIGLALSYLLDYLDDTVRNARDLENLNLTLLAQVPSRRGLLQALGVRRRLP